MKGLLVNNQIEYCRNVLFDLSTTC